MQFVIVQPDGATVFDEVAALPERGFVWCDCSYEDGRAWTAPVQQLTGVGVFEDHLLDAENPAHPSYFDSTNEYEMIVFRGLAIRTDTIEPSGVIRVKTRPAVFFVFPRVLVTVRAPDNRLVSTIRDRLLAGGRARLPALPEELMLRLLNGMVDRYLDLRQPLSEQFERRQRQLLDPRRPFRDWYELLESRREARRLQDLCEEQLDALQEWRDERLERTDREAGEPRDLHALDDALQVRTADIVGHIHRVLHHARRLESSVESAVQLHFSATAYRTNEVMRTLTAITAVFLPLTLITGVFGMNFEFIPGLHSESGFWWAIGSMVLIGAILFSFLRTRAMLSASDPFGRRRRRRASRASHTPAAAGAATGPDGERDA
ncbi:MAG: magnesium transporter CorA family protein [Burkholderiaceae bacterium]|nr:magnesium transporter CorA family protein [Burkholderiaceae bacterium]MEB2350226.1 magnesium transporter CorA family protein [Burkholderiaceae bacterium]